MSKGRAARRAERPARIRRPRNGAWALPALAVVGSTIAILAPLLRPGYVLAGDMVFAPQMPINRASVGLGSATPRAVPSDLVVALASHVLPGDLVQKLVLVLLMLAAGFGAARLAPAAALPRAAVALCYLWTPYLAERLLLGQWAVLVGWAVLPWLVAAALAVGDRPAGPERYRAWANFAFIAGLMSLGGAPAWLLALLTGPITLASTRCSDLRAAAGRAVAGAAVVTLFALPWAVPALLRPGGVPADARGADAFAPAASSSLGVVADLLTGGGVWNSAAVPPGRTAAGLVLAALALTLIGVAGLRMLADRRLLALAIAGGLGLAVALLTAWGAGARFVADLPGGALIRDSPRLLAPWLLLVALGFGAAITAVAERVRPAARPAVALLALAPAAVLPSLAWGVSGRLVPVAYPAGFAQVRDTVAADHRAGAVLVLPFEAYRRFVWNGGRTVLDPLSRWFDRTVVASSDLPVEADGRIVVVRGEDRLADRAGVAVRAAHHGRPLAPALGRLGIRWVAVDDDVNPTEVFGLHLVRRTSAVTLYEIPAGLVRDLRDPAGAYAAPFGAVLAGDTIMALALIASGLWAHAPAARPRLRLRRG